MRKLSSLVYYDEKEFAYIPTRGLATSVIDAYRSHQIVMHDPDETNAGVVFHKSYNDIAVFENELNSMDDLIKFETALRFIILREDINVLEPSLRTSIDFNGNSFDSYSRIPAYALESADRIYQMANAMNTLLPTEKVFIKDGKVIKSTNPKSRYQGLKQEELASEILKDEASRDFLHTLPHSFSVPFIYGYETSSNAFEKIYSDFLSSLDLNYSENTKYSYEYGYNIKLPFFTNAVLGMAANRDDIPEAVLQLRDNISPLRHKLFKYELDFKSIKSPKELAMIQSDIENAIKAATKTIYDPTSLFGDSVNLLINLVKNAHQVAGKIFNKNYSLSNDYPVLFGSSNYKLMKKLVSMDNVNTNISNFLTDQEISNLKG
jgi:hypothetical protein